MGGGRGRGPGGQPASGFFFGMMETFQNCVLVMLAQLCKFAKTRAIVCSGGGHSAASKRCILEVVGKINMEASGGMFKFLLVCLAVLG